jgi:hypothetical protein
MTAPSRLRGPRGGVTVPFDRNEARLGLGEISFSFALLAVSVGQPQ